eukprot:Awhi_evm1s1567
MHIQHFRDSSSFYQRSSFKQSNQRLSKNAQNAKYIDDNGTSNSPTTFEKEIVSRNSFHQAELYGDAPSDQRKYDRLRNRDSKELTSCIRANLKSREIEGNGDPKKNASSNTMNNYDEGTLDHESNLGQFHLKKHSQKKYSPFFSENKFQVIYQYDDNHNEHEQWKQTHEECSND